MYWKPVFKDEFSRFLGWDTSNHLICFEKDNKYYLKAKNSLHTTGVSSLKFVFIVCFERNQMLKYTFYKNHNFNEASNREKVYDHENYLILRYLYFLWFFCVSAVIIIQWLKCNKMTQKSFKQIHFTYTCKNNFGVYSNNLSL